MIKVDDTWWPPKVGDKLRRFTLHGNGEGGVKKVHALVHVVAVFVHAGRYLVTVAEWFPSRQRWSYETISITKAQFGEYWPDGSPVPAGTPAPDAEAAE